MSPFLNTQNAEGKGWGGLSSSCAASSQLLKLWVIPLLPLARTVVLSECISAPRHVGIQPNLHLSTLECYVSRPDVYTSQSINKKEYVCDTLFDLNMGQCMIRTRVRRSTDSTTRFVKRLSKTRNPKLYAYELRLDRKWPTMA